MDIKQLAKKYTEDMITLRRDFHQHPELALHEARTRQKICEELTRIGIPYEIVGQGNVVGFLAGSKPGKKIAIRGDIDALAIHEELDVPFKSENPGVMHACGHDGHTAILLGVAKILNDLTTELAGSVYLCFQVAEEPGVGGMEIVSYLQEKGGVDQAIGLHLMGNLALGSILLPDGPIMAGIGGFKIDVTGRGGHGSRPDLAINPIHAACDILLKISAIPTNRHSPFDTCVVSPCLIQGGTSNNIIPDTTQIAGNVRYLRYGDAEKLMDAIEQIATHTAAAYGATATLFHKGKIGKKMGVPVINDAVCAERGRQIAAEMGLSVLTPQNPNLGSDDFCWFLEAFPGFYANLGCRSDRPDSSDLIHNSKYDIHEDSLALGAEFMARYAYRFLQT